MTALVLLYLIAAWAIITGIFEKATDIRLRREIRGEWALIIGGVLFGEILIVVSPFAAILSLVWLIGIYAVAFGIMMLIPAFSVRGGDSGSSQRPSRVV